MSVSAMLYLVSMATLFVGQRMLEGNDGPQMAVTIVGCVVLAAAAGLRLGSLRRAKDPGLRLGHRLAMIGLLGGVASLVLYTATTDGVIDTLTLGDEAEERWLGTWRSLWPLMWLIGTVPMLTADYACESSPTMMPKRRARELALHGLIVAMGIGLAFPVNYIASQRKERWDLAYFKTPQPGTATLALAQALESPVDVRIFMPPSSEVAQELQNYFGPLEGPMFRVEVIDQAAEPRLAKALAVRNNGTITFTQGDILIDVQPPAEGEEAPPQPVTRNVKVDADFDKAKRALKKIDADVQKVLIELGHGERIAYVTTGHGELTWRRAAQPVPELQANGLREELKSQGFTVKELGLREKLSEGVPPDASLVMVLGPRYPFSQAETDSLRGYLESGGALFVALEPGAARARLPAPVEDPLDAMVAEVMGVTVGEGILADEVVHARSAGDKRDNFLVLTDSFSSHGSSVTLAAERQVFGAPFTGYLELEDGHAAAHTVTVRSMATAFVDENRDASFSADAGEVKGTKPIAAAVSGSTNAVGWRAIVVATSSVVSDVALGGATDQEGSTIPGNIHFVRDTTNWLIGAEALSGTTQSEEDVKIEHTKEGQTWWFYSTVLGVPLLVFGLGVFRVRMRRRGQQASVKGDAR